jgi:FixJ family two-component response regulator
MPEMDGLELQRHLNREGITIPTIVITAHGKDGMRELCEAAGAETYLLKPLQDTILLAAVDEARARTARARREQPPWEQHDTDRPEMTSEPGIAQASVQSVRMDLKRRTFAAGATIFA